MYHFENTIEFEKSYILKEDEVTYKLKFHAFLLPAIAGDEFIYY